MLAFAVPTSFCHLWTFFHCDSGFTLFLVSVVAQLFLKPLDSIFVIGILGQLTKGQISRSPESEKLFTSTQYQNFQQV